MVTEVVDRFLRNIPQSVRVDLLHLLEQELDERGGEVALVEYGEDDTNRALLRYTGEGEQIEFYFLTLPTANSPARVEKVSLAAPVGARVTLVKEVRRGPGESQALCPTRVVAEHESLPQGRVSCEYPLDEAEQARIEGLFYSWVEPTARVP